MLIALLNVFRIYYNWFEARPYVSALAQGKSVEEVEPRLTFARIPGSGDVVPIEKRRATKPVLRTPAMRHGIQADLVARLAAGRYQRFKQADVFQRALLFERRSQRRGQMIRAWRRRCRRSS